MISNNEEEFVSPDEESQDELDEPAVSATEPEIADSEPPPKPGPWGFWATIGFTAVVAFIYIMAQVAVVVGFVVYGMATNTVSDFENLENNGLLLCLATVASAVVCIPIIFLLAKFKKHYPVREYLALHPFTVPTAVKWLVITTCFIVINDFLMYITGQPIVPQFMIDVYTTAPLFVVILGIVIAAPLAEEFFFRGFVFQGLVHSKLGAIGTIVLTSLVFGLIHTQYNWVGIVSAMVIGLILGTARHQTGSLYLAILLHAFMNVVATLQVMYTVHWIA